MANFTSKSIYEILDKNNGKSDCEELLLKYDKYFIATQQKNKNTPNKKADSSKSED